MTAPSSRNDLDSISQLGDEFYTADNFEPDNQSVDAFILAERKNSRAVSIATVPDLARLEIPASSSSANLNVWNRRVSVTFDPTSIGVDGYLAVEEGEMVRVLQKDDGKGWTKVRNTSRQSGLVPTSIL